jgi:hypothetical protein
MQVKNVLVVLVACFLGLTALTVSARGALVPAIAYDETWSRPDGKQMTAEQVQELIRGVIREHLAEGKFPWRGESTSDGKILATTLVRNKHEVRVLISNTATSFSMVYYSSMNMKAEKGEDGRPVLHSAYHRWTGDLVKAIRQRLIHA